MSVEHKIEMSLVNVKLVQFSGFFCLYVSEDLNFDFGSQVCPPTVCSIYKCIGRDSLSRDLMNTSKYKWLVNSKKGQCST